MTRARYDISLFIDSVAAHARMRAAMPAAGVSTGAGMALTDANTHALARRNEP